MHACPECHSICSCDVDDMMFEDPPADCRHRCAPFEEYDDGPYALPDEFDDDDGQHDFSEEDVVT